MDEGAKALPERFVLRLLGRDQRTGHQMTFQTDDIRREPFPQITATSASAAFQRASRPILGPNTPKSSKRPTHKTFHKSSSVCFHIIVSERRLIVDG